jgi:hypothetical protein
LITLPHHFEFLSDRWLDEARSYLTRAVERRHEGHAPFSVSIRLSNAPPHLQFPEGTATCSARHDGAAVVVDRSFLPAADLVLEGDYQAALTAAQTVGALAPGVMAAALDEVALVFGSDALRVRGRVVDDPTRELLCLLHDHLARSTVENPDLAHRAERLGIAAEVRHIE